MHNRILGLHHITAIAGDAQGNYDFYTRVLGLRLVKKTVNFDDPQTYHFYYGDKKGTPGSILTFFPWPGAKKGKNGAGMATEIGYTVPEESLEFWQLRLDKYNVPHEAISKKFDEKCLALQDPDGLNLSLIESGPRDDRTSWQSGDIDANYTIKGFHSVTLTLNDPKPTAELLTEIFGYEYIETEKNSYRYRTSAVDNAAIVDIEVDPEADMGRNSVGTNHHVAFRVKDEKTQMEFRNQILDKGFEVTEKINRDYFYSIYFREPGGILFEIATDNPGFATDESVEELGKKLQLPNRYEAIRSQIEKILPPIKQ